MNIYDNQYLKLKESKLQEIISKDKSVSQVCRELDVSRPTVYEWLSRYRRFGIHGLVHRKRVHRQVPVNKTKRDVEEKVITLANKYFHDGVETLHDRLEHKHGISLHPVTIFRILKRTNTRYQDKYTTTQRNWKTKLYSHEIAGQEIQMDTCFPYGYKQGKVLYTAIDDASRFVFAWIFLERNQENTLDFLQKLVQHFPFKIQKIRMDQGREFTALSVKKFLDENDILVRYNTPYCPEENGKIERFHKTLKSKCMPYGFTPSMTLDSFQYRLTLFLHYYNYIKKHRGLGMEKLTPFAKLKKLKVLI